MSHSPITNLETVEEARIIKGLPPIIIKTCEKCGMIKCTCKKEKLVIRSFEGGAVRDTSEGKLDYFGFMHPLIDKSFADYMHEHRKMSDGSLRDANNWWGMFDKSVTIQSLTRHVEDLKAIEAGYRVFEVRYKDEIKKFYKTNNGSDLLLKECSELDCFVKEIDAIECLNAIRFNADAHKGRIMKDNGDL